MTYPRRPEDGPWHMRLKCRPNTPDEQVAAFLSGSEFFLCELYNCRMSRSACGKRRATAQEQSDGGSLPLYGKCLVCDQGRENKMDPKKCHVDGCGKKVLAKGMCSTHYFKARAKEKADETKAPAPETKPPIPETKTPDPEKKPDPPATPAPPKKPENMHENMQAEKKPNENKTRGTVKRVNVQFSGPDVAIWERLRDSARRNRRDIRTEALYIIEQSLAVESEVYS